MNVLFRADASPVMGTGHVMRCLALAEVLREQGARVRFACRELTEALAERLDRLDIGVVRLDVGSGTADDQAAVARAAHAGGEDWVVLDGYGFDAEYQVALQEQGLRVVTFDDAGRLGTYTAQVVVNANLFADPAWYRERGEHTRLLLGPRYAPLRREFGAWQDWVRRHPKVAQRLLVTLGGADPMNATQSVIDALELVESRIDAVIVIGGSNPRLEQLSSAAARVGAEVIVDATEMAELLAAADIAICSSGTTALELACMGLPALLMVTAENQRRVAAAMEAAGVGLRVSATDAIEIARRLEALILDRAGRQEMSRRGRTLVDGRGAARIAQAMRAISEISLIRASPEHRRQVWEWANDPETRRFSLGSEPIPWEDHARWYDERLRRSPPDLFIVVRRASEPIGQIRLEVHGRRGRMPINLAPAYRGLGYGSLVIDVGAAKLFGETEVEAIDVYVRPDNEASVRAFQRADFHLLEVTVKDGERVLHLERRRDALPVARI